MPPGALMLVNMAIFFRLLRRLNDAILSHRGAEAYVRRTIVTTAISWSRRRSFHERPVDSVPDRERPDDTEGLVAHDLLWEQVRGLPPRQRAALVLRYHEDLSEAETAALMGCTAGTSIGWATSGRADCVGGA